MTGTRRLRPGPHGEGGRLDCAGPCHFREEAGSGDHVSREEDAAASVDGGTVAPRRAREIECTRRIGDELAPAPGDSFTPAGHCLVEQALDAAERGLEVFVAARAELRLQERVALRRE